MKLPILNKKDGDWRPWFAWHPVETGDHTAWLEFVSRRWNPELNFRIIDWCDPGDYEGGWEYEVLA